MFFDATHFLVAVALLFAAYVKNGVHCGPQRVTILAVALGRSFAMG
jgi:hypothetical protein